LTNYSDLSHAEILWACLVEEVPYKLQGATV